MALGILTMEHLTTVSLATLFITLGGVRLALIKLSTNEDGRFDYLPVVVNLCTESLKLLICCGLSVRHLIKEKVSVFSCCVTSFHDFCQLLKWSIPGFLYFCDNLVTFFIVEAFEPAVVVLLTNIKIISTAILFRIVLKRKLSSVQWASLVILFLAIVALSLETEQSQCEHPKSANTSRPESPTQAKDSQRHTRAHERVLFSQPDRANDDTHVAQREQCYLLNQRLSDRNNLPRPETFPFLRKYSGHFCILLQCLLSSLANIYNEKIFKEGRGLEDSIYIQNTKLYFFGVIFNICSIFFIDDFWSHARHCGLFSGFNIYSTTLILNTALLGLTISLILKFRDNMFHILSAQVLTVTVVTFSVIVTCFHPSLPFFLQAPTVLLAIYVFSVSGNQTPVNKSELEKLQNGINPVSDL